MHLEKYELKTEDDGLRFGFISDGTQGNIQKIVIYTKIPDQILPMYNLGFGDKNLVTGDISDTIASNNGDRNKVLATVASTVYIFTEKYPNAWIAMKGSTPTRTRLYQMGINLYYNEIIADFVVLGQVGTDWFPFEKNKNYEAFIITKKYNFPQ